MSIRPLSTLQVTRHQIPAHGKIPNTSIQSHPLLIYRSVFSASTTASTIESHLQSIGAAIPQWRYTMYSTSHFHSTTHEVLCIAAGAARLLLGGDGNPGAVEVTVRKGDVVVVPAGVAHRLLEDLGGEGDEDGDTNAGFGMVGAYPPGRRWDMCYGVAGEEEAVRGIEKLAWFERDPIYGGEGPVLEAGAGDG